MKLEICSSVDEETLRRLQAWLNRDSEVTFTLFDTMEALSMAAEKFQEEEQGQIFDSFTHFASPSSHGLFYDHLIAAANEIESSKTQPNSSLI
jgi:hypothetical protein